MDCVHMYIYVYVHIHTSFLLKTNSKTQQRPLLNAKRQGITVSVAEAVGSHLAVCFFFFLFLTWLWLLFDFMLNQSRELLEIAAV